MCLRKRTILFMIGFAAIILIPIIIAIGIQPSTPSKPTELKLLHVIFRHGKRTPADTYPKDPYINETFFPFGWGQLTNVGKLDMYNLGIFLRNRYGKFLGEFYFPEEFYAQTTETYRSISSAQLVNAGLWHPKANQKWGPLDWQPIPVHYEQLSDDMLLLVRKPCPQYNIELGNVMQSEIIQEKLKQNQELFENLTRLTGKTVTNFDDVQDIFSTLKAEKHFGLKLPKWTKDYFPNKMLEPTIFSFTLNVYNDKLNRLKGGLLLKKLMNDWRNVAESGMKTKTSKAFLYGGHDSTIVNILSALKVWDPQEPDYGTTVLLEFSRELDTKKFGLQIFLRNSTTSPPYQLTIPGCTQFCTMETLENLLQNVIPVNWEEECRSSDPNYILPPQRPP